MNPIPHFSQRYAEARDKFLAAARARGARIFREVHPSDQGADGEELSIDVAFIGDVNAAGLLLLGSGTHGVEGFCGSGCQVALLHDEVFIGEVERAGVGVLMLHALNPYGFSHLRRANEDNIDLNRNFMDFRGELPANPAYLELHPRLLPDAWPPVPENEAALAAWVAKHGVKAYQAAISGGQYQLVEGMFYGGARPSWSNACLRAILRAEAASRARLGWIDFHTGLGPRGHGEKIYAGPDTAGDLARARAWWGDELTSYYDGSSRSARVSGVVCTAAFEECPRTEVTAIALEYGTYSLELALHAMRAEHWLHNHPQAPAAQRASIKRHMRDMFYVDSDDWKAMVYAQARSAALVAVARLSSQPIRT